MSSRLRIVAASIPNKVAPIHRADNRENIFYGFPGILTALPQDADIVYLDDYNDLFTYDDSKVDIYAVEVWTHKLLPPGFKSWVQWVGRDKIVIGGYKDVYGEQRLSELAGKIVLGLCDNWEATLAQDGDIVDGIVEFKKLPRYDIFDLDGILQKNNVNLALYRRGYGLATSWGCYNNCDFCSATIKKNNARLNKPLDYLEEEVKLMHSIYGTRDVSFLYDSNFTQFPLWREKLEILVRNDFSRGITFFGSANTLKENDVSFLKKNRVTGVLMGLEDVNKEYPKNKNIEAIARKLYEANISLYLTYILNPEDLVDPSSEQALYHKLVETVKILKPTTMENNILRIMPGTTLHHQMREREGFNITEYFRQTSNGGDSAIIDFFTKDRNRTIEIMQNVWRFDRFFKENLTAPVLRRRAMERQGMVNGSQMGTHAQQPRRGNTHQQPRQPENSKNAIDFGGMSRGIKVSDSRPD